MDRPSGAFQASKIVQQVVKRFGAAGKEISVPMRDCDDVSRYIQRMENAHQQTANSTLHFGPPAQQSRNDA